jgi:hypothetical protein
VDFGGGSSTGYNFIVSGATFRVDRSRHLPTAPFPHASRGAKSVLTLTRRGRGVAWKMQRSPIGGGDAAFFRPPPQPLSLAARMAIANAAGGDDDVDWAAVAIKGTNTKLEKSYFRLTSAPDPSSVRPEPVLREALAALLAKPERNYWCVHLLPLSPPSASHVLPTPGRCTVRGRAALVRNGADEAFRVHAGIR